MIMSLTKETLKRCPYRGAWCENANLVIKLEAELADVKSVQEAQERLLREAVETLGHMISFLSIGAANPVEERTVELLIELKARLEEKS
jgi:hypothetical protein